MGRLKTAPSRLQGVPSRYTCIAADSWRAGKSSSTARGYGYRWQQYREQYLAKHPLCGMCQARGLVTAATIVDHIVPHKGDARLFWGPNNHQSLCKDCHDGPKAAEEAAAGYR
jgi:5-methylcytosine-specific restriction enzyme A